MNEAEYLMKNYGDRGRALKAEDVAKEAEIAERNEVERKVRY